MKEFFDELNKLEKIIYSQLDIFEQFYTVLEEEEVSLSLHSLSELEKAVIKKDQIIKIATSIDERRTESIKKALALMSYDYRKQTLSFNLFLKVFDIYLEKVSSLIEAEDRQKLVVFRELLVEKVEAFKELYKKVEPRIYRNAEVIKKLSRHVKLSLNLFQSQFQDGVKYDYSGKAASQNTQLDKVSFLRVRV